MRKLFSKYSLLTYTIFYALLCFCSCKQGAPVESRKPAHMAEVNIDGVGMIYIDAVANQTIMKKTNADDNVEFRSFLVGFQSEDAVTMNTDIEKGKYFLFEMYKDWTVIAGMDSLKPVFFQPKTKLRQQVDEGIIVFEMPKGTRADTLIYNDSYGPWGNQRIAVNKFN